VVALGAAQVAGRSQVEVLVEVLVEALVEALVEVLVEGR
jgi:hypothetical protein